MSDLLGLSLVFFIAFMTESAVGFGSALIVIALASHLLPITTLFPVFQPLALALSATVVWKNRRDVDVAFLFRAVLPPIIPGLALGMILFRVWRNEALLLLVGLGIAGLAMVELVETVRGGRLSPLPPRVSRVVLFVAGILHGLFGTSGPPVVYVASRQLADKARFRATLALLWLLLSAVLVVGFVGDGSLGLRTIGTSLLLAPALIAGFVVGDRIHRVAPARLFRIAVAALLVLAGVTLAVRSLSDRMVRPDEIYAVDDRVELA